MRLAVLSLLLLVAADVSAQQRAGEWAWKPIVEQDSVAVRYIFYSEADNANNGVVLRLDNHNPFAVSYRFVVLFRSLDSETEREVTGRVGPRTMITGDDAGLFFIPFEDGREVIEIGMRGFRIERVDG